MGRDLKMLPMTILRDNWAFSHTILPVNRCSELFDEMLTLSSLTVPSTFNTYVADNQPEGERTGNTQKDEYGDPLKYVLVRDLLTLKDHEGVQLFGNKGVWAYLEHLPADAKAALYWE